LPLGYQRVSYGNETFDTVTKLSGAAAGESARSPSDMPDLLSSALVANRSSLKASFPRSALAWQSAAR
jgi:hypothetical protein